MRLGMMVALAVGVVVLWSAGAGAQGACPPGVAALVPANGANITCSFSASGEVGLGSTKADLPFDHVCTRSNKYPARITTEVQVYKGQAAKLLQMQITSVEQQTLQSKQAEFEKDVSKIRSNPQVENVSGVKSEGVPGGKLLYYSYDRDCSEGEKRAKPVVNLVGVGHTASASIKVNLEGYTTIDAAKTAASQVIANLSKASF